MRILFITFILSISSAFAECGPRRDNVHCKRLSCGQIVDAIIYEYLATGSNVCDYATKETSNQCEQAVYNFCNVDSLVSDPSGGAGVETIDDIFFVR